MSPALFVTAVPDAIEMLPLFPLFAIPVPTLMAPLSPTLAVPVDSTKYPLTPDAPALAVSNNKFPDVVIEL